MHQVIKISDHYSEKLIDLLFVPNENFMYSAEMTVGLMGVNQKLFRDPVLTMLHL